MRKYLKYALSPNRVVRGSAEQSANQSGAQCSAFAKKSVSIPPDKAKHAKVLDVQADTVTTQAHNVKIAREIWKKLTQLGLILMMGMSMSACSKDWKEEVLLHDGQKIIVKRSQSYGGSGEIGQSAPIRDHTITFTLPNTQKSISFKSEFSEDVGRANFNLLALHILNGTPYLVVEPNLCLAYNKWGRPNPPYVIYKHDGNKWQRITIAELPTEFKTLNLIINNGREEDIERSANKQGYVSVEGVRSFNSSLRQQEYQALHHNRLPQARINEICMEMILYKGYWIMPNDPVAHSMIDRKSK